MKPWIVSVLISAICDNLFQLTSKHTWVKRRVALRRFSNIDGLRAYRLSKHAELKGGNTFSIPILLLTNLHWQFYISKVPCCWLCNCITTVWIDSNDFELDSFNKVIAHCIRQHHFNLRLRIWYLSIVSKMWIWLIIFYVDSFIPLTSEDNWCVVMGWGGSRSIIWNYSIVAKWLVIMWGRG